MIPTPISLGLSLCDLAIVERDTLKVSLVGTFDRFNGPEFPYRPSPFWVFATLTEGNGEGEVCLAVTHLESDEEVYSLVRRVSFANPLEEVRVLFRLAECIFPVPGAYLFVLLVDGEWVTQRRVRVLSRETDE